MSDIVINIQGIWKEYRLGTVSHGRMVQDLQSWWARVRGQEDPNIPLDNLSRRANSSRGASADRFWALRDVSFEVKRGEVVGIIGRNGAGKSTLLKILSKVTSPTKGQITYKGRIASLLEVGTGFHPELSGRENIFLNGAILGMTRDEIRRKFDEIVAFSELEAFIDTPVKRYSSGMYVRLAFAVAAHLEPEILVFDEVLAVGDATFQKKCLGKMGEVSQAGRTILFVSHNMTAVKALCPRAILLDAGALTLDGKSDQVISGYLQSSFGNKRMEAAWTDPQTAPGNGKVWLTRVAVVPKRTTETGEIDVGVPLDIIIEFMNMIPGAILNASVVLYTQDDICVLNTGSGAAPRARGLHRLTCEIPGDFLNDETYRVRILIVEDSSKALLDQDHLVSFEVRDCLRQGQWFGKWVGVVRPTWIWHAEHLEAAPPR